MTSTFRCVRRLSAVVATCLVSGMVTTDAALAQSSTVTFNTLTESAVGSGTRFLTNCYAESGFVFTAVGVPCTGPTSLNTFIAGNANSPTFSGAAGTFGLTLNSPTASFIDITRANGMTFTPLSIMLAPFDLAATMVTFTGVAMGGSNVTQPLTSLLGTSGFQTVTFGSQFANVTSLRIASSNQFQEPYVRLDNFNVVPEPTTVVLLAAGLAGLAAVRFRRRNVV